MSPLVNPVGSVTGAARVNVASGYCPVRKLAPNCGCGLPDTVIAARSTRAVAPVTRLPEMTTVPVTMLVRPTASLLKPMAVSWTRKPAIEPSAIIQLPPSGPLGALTGPAGSASGAAVGPNLTNAHAASTTRTTTAATAIAIQRSQRRFRGGRPAA